MKKLLLKSMLLLCALIVGSSSVWAADYEVTYNKAALASMLSGDYVDATSYWKVPDAAGGSATIAIPITYQPTSDITITFNIATFGSGTNPSSSNTTITAIGTESSSNWSGSAVSTYPSSSTFVNGVMTITKPASPTTLGGLTITMGVNSGVKIFRLNSIKVSYTYAVSSDPSSEATFDDETPSLDLKDAATYTQVASTVGGYSTTPGASVTYSITGSNTALATIDENTGEVTPTQAGSVTVKADAVAIAGKFSASSATYTLTVTDTRVFTVTYHAGSTSNNVDRNSGATLSLDNPSALCGMSFVGWSSTNNAAAPTWVANTTKVTGDMELYAMYQAVEGQYSYRLVESSLSDWRGDYLIAYSSEIFADGRVGGTDGLGKQNTAVDPETNLSGNVVDATWGDIYNITIEAVNDNKLSDGYLMITKDGKYNYQASNSNGLASTETRATAAGHALSITFNSSSDIDIAISAGAQFHYNEQGYFRFYKDGGQKNVYLYKRTEDVAPVYSLGITESITPGHAKITYVTPEIMDFSKVSGLKAYVATDAAAAGVTMTRVETAVPEGTPLLLIGTAGTTYNVPIIASATAPATNKLVAGDGATDMSGVSGYNYILYSDGLFYQVTSGTIATTKAYLHLTSNPTAGGARSLDIVFDDETTGIDATLVNSEKVNSDVYDLQGRKVAQPTKGLYIVNGKKVIIK